MAYSLARNPRHIISVFNLVLEIHVMINWQLSKTTSIRWAVSHDCIADSGTQLIEVTYFLKLSADQFLVSGPFLKGGIQFDSCLWQNLDNFFLWNPGAVRRLGRKAGRNFQVRPEEPLGTDSQRTISKISSRCRLLIGHKKFFVFMCPIGEHISWVLFVCSYTRFFEKPSKGGFPMSRNVNVRTQVKFTGVNGTEAIESFRF